MILVLLIGIKIIDVTFESLERLDTLLALLLVSLASSFSISGYMSLYSIWALRHARLSSFRVGYLGVYYFRVNLWCINMRFTGSFSSVNVYLMDSGESPLSGEIYSCLMTWRAQLQISSDS